MSVLSAASVQERDLSVRPAGLRLLHIWHLWSLDAPTVAACWTVLFCRVARVGDAVAAATALACAVWLVYAIDRLLDAAKSGAGQGSRCELTRLYRDRRRAMAGVAMVVGPALVATLCMLPPRLVEAWMLLAVPLFGYGVGVHVLGLPARWKAVCVGVFFGAAVVLPAATHHVVSAAMLGAAAIFGGVCRANCEVLRTQPSRFGALLFVVGLGAVWLMVRPGAGEIGFACALSLLLLAALRANRARFSPLTYRALADAALVVAPLLLLAA